MPSLMSTPVRTLVGAWAGRFWVMGVVLLFALACQGDHLTRAPLADADHLYWDLRLTQRAVTLSLTPPYDTLTLEAIPHNQFGTALENLPAPQYQSLNTDRVLVTPAGLLIAVATTPRTGKIQLVPIIATLTDGNLKHVDTVFVKVVANAAPPRLASLSIDPLPPDSAKMGSSYEPSNYGPKFLAPQLLDSNGRVMTGIPVAFWSSNPAIADLLGLLPPPSYQGVGLPAGLIRGRASGMVTFYASTTAFGITKVDTLPYRIGYPLIEHVLIYGRVSQVGDTVPAISGEITIGIGGMVDFKNALSSATDITFADADIANITAVNTYADFNNPHGTPDDIFAFAFGQSPASWYCGSVDCTAAGNAVGVPAGGRIMRVFQAPGIYEYHASGASGRIIVVDES